MATTLALAVAWQNTSFAHVIVNMRFLYSYIFTISVWSGWHVPHTTYWHYSLGLRQSMGNARGAAWARRPGGERRF